MSKFVALHCKVPPVVCQHTASHCHCHYNILMSTFFAPRLLISTCTSTHLVWFQNYMTDKQSMKFWTITTTLTLNTAIQYFHKTLHLMMYYQISLVAKGSAVLKILFRRYHPDEHSLTFWTNLFTRHWLMRITLHSWPHKEQQFRRYNKNVIFWL